MSFTNRPWDAGAMSKGKEAGAYCACCLIDLNTGGKKIKSKCKLPVRSTPGGAWNLNAMSAAAAVLAGGRGGVHAPAAAKRKAARKLVRLYRQAKRQPPSALLRVAGMKR